jgi:simple sugar transport system substrate-binding protein
MLGHKLLVGAVAGSLIVGAACGGSATGATTKPVVGLQVVLANFVGATIHKGVDDVAQKAGWDVIFLSPNANPQIESQDIDQLITRHVDVILYAPSNSTTMTTNIQKAINAKIPVVCFDTCVDNAQQLGVKGLATSDALSLGTLAGKGLGQYINDKLGGSAKVAFLTCESNHLCLIRRDGLLKGIASTGAQIQILANQESFQTDTSDKVATDLMTAHPDLQMIIGENTGAIAGAYAAVKRSGKKVVVGGSDMDPIIAQDMLAGDGIVVATASQDPFKMGQTAMQMGIDVLNGKTISPWEVDIPGPAFSYKDLAAVQTWLTANPPVSGK